ncbi:hypothetical protein D7B24_007566 [Verticillium nonalfalfae]|uniref:Uncharacterized protein n=1 Tax=Verticillium nonalfalfae TaxID=1051616 RepID=A0A3M9Y8C5_9PEZI|nr:uncharacterized protein D7B24_007566 [Verticillium nonalfalfae]RNJ56282.1 hypothetical protein D7B24_007566 [Verticillium nonalfalfae]
MRTFRLALFATTLLSNRFALGDAQQFGAVELSLQGIVPRFFVDAPQLVRRDGPPCPPDRHRCIDIGQDSLCCANDHYCYINPEGEGKCCAIGSNCDSACDATAYQCPTTITRQGTTSASSACCGRSCPTTSFFRCEDEFGGECCPHGHTCASGGICRSTRTPTPSALVTAMDAGCTAATQRACPDEGGCCDEWMHCTRVSGEPFCALGNSDTGYTFTPDSGDGGSGGLSTGAKAGIGIGIAVGISVLFGIFAWVCIIRRRRRRQRSLPPSEGQQQQQQTSRTAQSPGQAVSEVTDLSRPTRGRGLTQDYFGPAAVEGPYTENAASTTTSPGRGVPVQANSPNDIAAPVEIDSRITRGLERTGEMQPAAVAASGPETTEGRFELGVGDEVLPQWNGRQSQVLTPGSITSVSGSEYRTPGP